MTDAPTSGAPRAGSRRCFRRLLFPLLAVALSLLPLAVGEAVCRWMGWGMINETQDPYVGFTSIRPLFALSDDGRRYEIARERLVLFCPDSFAAQKGPDEFRIFCLGGSTVQGRPYAIDTSFTTWLELSLQAAQPDRSWEVVNCGGVSYASYRLVPILNEVLGYEPDLIILYTGHNEFLEDRTYRQVKTTPPLVIWAHAWFSRSRLYNAARSTWIDWKDADLPDSASETTQLDTEVHTLLDDYGGLAAYHRDDVWRAGAVEHYRANLERMIQLARQRGVPVMLVNPVSNLKDCPPFKMANSDDLSRDDLVAFDQLWEAARQSAELELEQRIELLRGAVAIDPRHAGAQFLLGVCLLEQGRTGEAKTALIRAKDEDLCPLRMIEPLHAALQQVASAYGVPLVDARRLFEQQSRHGIPGSELLIDHIHPTVNGHQMIADALLREMAARQFVRLADGWQQRQQQRYRNHIAALNGAYFVRGRERLEGLRKWTEGRARTLRVDPP